MPNGLNPEQITSLKSLLAQEAAIELQLAAFHPRHVMSARNLVKYETKQADGKELDDQELLAMEVAMDVLLGRYQGKQSRPVGLGIEPLPPMSPADRTMAAANQAYAGLENFVKGLKLDQMDQDHRDAGLGPLKFELIQMQPPKPPPLVEIGLWATIKRSVKLWWESRQKRKAQLKAYENLKKVVEKEKSAAKQLLAAEYQALPKDELEVHAQAIELAKTSEPKKFSDEEIASIVAELEADLEKKK